jgi:Putative peptidoglycan binding domain
VDVGVFLLFLDLLSRGTSGKSDKGAAAPADTSPAPGPMPGAGPTPDAGDTTQAKADAAPTPTPTAAAAPTVSPTVTPDTTTTSPAPSPANLPWPTGAVPSTLPPFPGPGWEPDIPVTAEVASRATYWNGLLWDFTTKKQRKPFVQENFGGQWITWAAAWHPDATGAPNKLMATEAWRVKPAAQAPVVTPVVVPAQAPAAAPAPSAAPTPHAAPPAAAPMSVQHEVVHVSPYPGPGAWKSNVEYVKRYQVALDALGYVGKDNQPLIVDGKVGPNTDFAVKAFQTAHGVKPADGQAGADTAKAIDAALDALAASHAGP